MYKNMSKNCYKSLTVPSVPFETNLQAFSGYRIPCELTINARTLGVDPEFDRWLKETVQKKEVRGCLEDLYLNYGILPAPVLLILAETKTLLLSPSSLFTPPQPLNKSMRQRRKDIKALDAAVKVIRDYDLEAHFPLRKFQTLRQALGTRRRKQSNIELRFCAQTLADFFRHVADQPLHEVIGSLLNYAFGWGRETSDLRLAALQRAKGPSINAKQIILPVAIDFQERKRFSGERLAPVKVALRTAEAVEAEKAKLAAQIRSFLSRRKTEKSRAAAR
jgi:hypothetical protein